MMTDRDTRRAGTLIANTWMQEVAHPLVVRDYMAIVKIGSLLVQIDRHLPGLDQDEPKRAAAVRDGLGKFEAKLARRGIDPQRARATAIRHTTPMAQKGA